MDLDDVRARTCRTIWPPVPLLRKRSRAAGRRRFRFCCAAWNVGNSVSTSRADRARPQILRPAGHRGGRRRGPQQRGPGDSVPRGDRYLQDGPFDPERMIAWIQARADAAARAGFSGLRLVRAELAGVCPGRLSRASSVWLNTKRKLNQLLWRGQPVSALCSYDRKPLARGPAAGNPGHAPAGAGGPHRLRQSALRAARAVPGRGLARRRDCLAAGQCARLAGRGRRSTPSNVNVTACCCAAAGEARAGAPGAGPRSARRSVPVADRAAPAPAATDPRPSRPPARCRPRHRRAGDRGHGPRAPLAHQLRPSVLDDLGLAAALRSHVKRQAQRAGFEVELDVDGLEGTALPAATVTTCFRIVQESLHQHRPTRARAAGRGQDRGGTPGLLDVMVHDDGRGFDLGAARERAQPGHQLGPAGHGRADRAGRRRADQVESTVGRGTTVHARLPWTGAGVT